MHVTFLAAGMMFWSVVLEPSGRRRLDYGSTLLFVFSTALITGLPGALMSFSQRLIYVAPNVELRPFGLTALEDQRLAGLIMWIPMDLLLFATCGWLFVAWLNRSEPRLHPTEVRG